MKKPDRYIIIAYALLVFVITLTYLPALKKATIYRDDWYYTVDRLKGGPGTFPKMFEIDRPARGYFFEAYYQLFGINPTPYHLVGFTLRLLAAVAAFWLFRLLWPDHIEAALVMSLLFAVYPGYTRTTRNPTVPFRLPTRFTASVNISGHPRRFFQEKSTIPGTGLIWASSTPVISWS